MKCTYPQGIGYVESCYCMSGLQTMLMECALTKVLNNHYTDVIMSTVASQITSLTIVYSSVCSGADQRKHHSSAPLAFVAQRVSNAENVSIWWRHHDRGSLTTQQTLRSEHSGHTMLSAKRPWTSALVDFVSRGTLPYCPLIVLLYILDSRDPGIDIENVGLMSSRWFFNSYFMFLLMLSLFRRKAYRSWD